MSNCFMLPPLSDPSGSESSGSRMCGRVPSAGEIQLRCSKPPTPTRSRAILELHSCTMSSPAHPTFWRSFLQISNDEHGKQSSQQAKRLGSFGRHFKKPVIPKTVEKWPCPVSTCLGVSEVQQGGNTLPQNSVMYFSKCPYTVWEQSARQEVRTYWYVMLGKTNFTCFQSLQTTCPKIVVFIGNTFQIFLHVHVVSEKFPSDLHVLLHCGDVWTSLHDSNWTDLTAIPWRMSHPRCLDDLSPGRSSNGPGRLHSDCVHGFCHNTSTPVFSLKTHLSWNLSKSCCRSFVVVIYSNLILDDFHSFIHL